MILLKIYIILDQPFKKKKKNETKNYDKKNKFL
jgi:hypothetical protein